MTPRTIAAAIAFLVTAAVAGAAPTLDGPALFREWCVRCHGEDGLGGGPDASIFPAPPPALRGNPVLARHTDAELIELVREGRTLQLGLRPEALREQSRRTEAIYRFLTRLPTVDWPDADAGRELYYARCLDCHDDYGRPGREIAPGSAREPGDLSGPEFQTAVSDAELALLVRHARPGMIPLRSPVTANEGRRLAAFVRLLSPGYELYDRFCQACHGIHGEGAGDAAPDSGRPAFAFDLTYFARRTPEAVLDRVWHMLKSANARMPHFGPSVGDEEVRAILEYLRSLPDAGAPGR